jgi:PHD/YefM family antitoxin component YafN of YafNO toxin-antitoxin module
MSVTHSQSLDDFREKADETLDRLNQTGEAEVLTVDGHPRAVLLSPDAYEELARESQQIHDASVIRQSIQDIRDGKGKDAELFFDELRAKLLAMKAAQMNGNPK